MVISKLVLKGCSPHNHFSDVPQEATQREPITLDADDERAVNEMLRFMYYFQYSPHGERNGIVLHMRVARIADKYDMTELRAAAHDKL